MTVFDCKMSLRYKYFCFGMMITSLTWIIALYLYHSLTHTVIKHDLSAPKEKSNSEEFLKSTHVRSKSKMDVPDNNVNIQWDNEVLDVKNKNRVLGKEYVIETKISEMNGPFDLGLIRYPEDLKVREEGYRKHAFNVLVSNRIGSHRLLPDTRNLLCKDQVYRSNLPSVSIIICFFNEAMSALLRTVHSVLDRTRANLIHEILLINDNSEHEELKMNLEKYIEKNFDTKVKLLHTRRREGLIRARMFGARQATGEVLMFLDSHCEVNEAWLEPLLSKIAENHTTVVCPIIDIINADTLAYIPSPIVRGGFNWGLHFKWDGLPTNSLTSKEDFIKPIKSPTMAGGLFAIDREFFTKIGEYDGGMDIWGGENLEISFRIWMCGGTLEIIPCSRIGHIFRRRRPYGSPTGQDTLLYNSLRVAHVWMDEYKEYFFMLRPDARTLSYGNVTERLELRKNLQCNSFDWYVKNIYPELKPPSSRHNQEKVFNLKEKQLKKMSGLKSRKRLKQKFSAKYQIQLHGTSLCIASAKSPTTKSSLLILRKCQHSKNQIWFETDKQELLLAEILCLDAGDQYPRLSKCHEMGGSQEWRHKGKTKIQFYNMATGLCLGIKNAEESETVFMEICTQSVPTLWDLTDVEPHQQL